MYTATTFSEQNVSRCLISIDEIREELWVGSWTELLKEDSCLEIWEGEQGTLGPYF